MYVCVCIYIYIKRDFTRVWVVAWESVGCNLGVVLIAQGLGLALWVCDMNLVGEVFFFFFLKQALKLVLIWIIYGSHFGNVLLER